MSARSHPLLLVGLLALALCLVWLMPTDAVARSVFQSDPGISPLDTPTSTPTSSPTPPPPPSASPSLFAPATVAPLAAPPTFALPTPPPTLEPPTIVPLPTPTPTSTPGVIGYLPPPTLTAPGAFAGGALPGSVIVGAAAAPSDRSAVAEPEADPIGSKSELAAIIDQTVLLFSYGWLCGGGALLIATAAALLWLVRGGRLRD